MILLTKDPYLRNHVKKLIVSKSFIAPHILFFVYLLFAVIACLIFLVIGTALSYIFLFAASLFLLPCLVGLASRFSPYTGVILAASFIKIFFASQIISLIILHRPDQFLLVPSETLLAIDTAIAGAILGIAAMALLRPLIPASLRILRDPLNSKGLRRLGYFCAVIGLTSQTIWNFNFGQLSGAQLATGNAASGVALFSYLAPMTILAISALAAASLIDSNGRKLFASDLLVVLGLYFLIVLPIATKSEPLRPLVAIALVAAIFKWRIKFVPLAAGVALLLFVSQVLHPVITASRLEALGSGQSTPAVFLSHLSDLLTNPDRLSNDWAVSDGLKYNRSSYYGKPTGFLDRFTPELTDRIVATSRDNHVGGFATFEKAAVAIIPQFLGVTRDAVGRQIAIESSLGIDMRNRAVGWSNSGLVADAYLAGGLSMVALGFMIFSLLSCVGALLTFGTNIRSVLWIPYCVQFLFVPADSTFERMAPAYFWGWIVLTAAIYIGLAISHTERRSSRFEQWTGHFKRKKRTNAFNTLRR